MKIAVIGSICFDTIYPYNKPCVQGFGGIYYSVVSLAEFLSPDDVIYPVSYTGRDKARILDRALNKYANIVGDYILQRQSKFYSVTIRYADSVRRKEQAKDIYPALRYDQLQQLQTMDVIYLNFITGRDLSLQTFRRLHTVQRALVYMDIHMLLYGFNRAGIRFLRLPKAWEEWLNVCHILQMNKQECETLAGSYFSSINEMKRYCTMLFERKQLKAVLLTLADAGVLVTYRDGRNIRSQHLTPERIYRRGDATGCGDVFGSAFIAKYIADRKPVKAARFANRMAGVKAGISGSGHLSRLRKYI